MNRFEHNFLFILVTVTGYHGLLDIRPQYQREYVYTPDKRDAVIDTLMKGFPLNIMYWVKRDGY